MASVNKFLGIGNATRDAQLRDVGSTQVAEFGLAMNDRWTDKDGEVKETVCFVDIKVWGKQADAVSRYVTKGKQVHVEGRLKTDTWDDKETGQKRSRLFVDAQRVTFLGSKDAGRPAQDEDETPAF